MSDLIKLALEETAGATSFANTGTAGGTFAASTEAPTAGAAGIIGNCIQTAWSTNKQYIQGGASAPFEPTAINWTVYTWFWVGNSYHGTSETKRIVRWGRGRVLIRLLKST
jgi:hypothetical protein